MQDSGVKDFLFQEADYTLLSTAKRHNVYGQKGNLVAQVVDALFRLIVFWIKIPFGVPQIRGSSSNLGLMTTQTSVCRKCMYSLVEVLFMEVMAYRTYRAYGSVGRIPTYTLFHSSIK